jgi:hypothetical protein
VPAIKTPKHGSVAADREIPVNRVANGEKTNTSGCVIGYLKPLQAVFGKHDFVVPIPDSDKARCPRGDRSQPLSRWFWVNMFPVQTRLSNDFRRFRDYLRSPKKHKNGEKTASSRFEARLYEGKNSIPGKS